MIRTAMLLAALALITLPGTRLGVWWGWWCQSPGGRALAPGASLGSARLSH